MILFQNIISCIMQRILKLLVVVCCSMQIENSNNWHSVWLHGANNKSRSVSPPKIVIFITVEKLETLETRVVLASLCVHQELQLTTRNYGIICDINLSFLQQT